MKTTGNRTRIIMINKELRTTVDFNPMLLCWYLYYYGECVNPNQLNNYLCTNENH